MTVLHLVRHGQSQWNLEKRLQGQADVPLTDLGRQQAAAAAERLAGHPVAAVLSSDLQRAVETARAVAGPHGLSIGVDARLREQAYGVLEGRTTEDVLADPGYDLLDAFAHAEGGESVADVHARVGAALADVIAAHPDDEVVVVSHGDTLRAALAWLAGRGPDDVPWAEVPNGSVTTVVVPSGGPPGS